MAPPRQSIYDFEQRAWYIANADGTRTFYDETTGDTFQIYPQGLRLYCENGTRRLYYLNANRQRLYYDGAEQQTQMQTPGYYQQQQVYTDQYGQGSTSYGLANLTVPATTYSRFGQSSSNGNGKTLATGYDERSGVKTKYAIGPAQSVTNREAWEQGVEASKLILGTDTGDTELPDPSYSMKRSTYFRVGRVFEILWAEPRGGTSGATASVITEDSRFADKYFTKRRSGIFTYEGQGVTKHGVKKSDHAIMYDGRLKDDPPGPLVTECAQRGESPMRTQKIRVDLNNDARWHPCSRVNLSKTYTIEHNVKVKDIGTVHPRSVDDLTALYWQILLNNSGLSDPRYETKCAGAMQAMRSRSDSGTSH
ncbi:hypothetical protein AC579_9259 [Pseudocercospora musae]|uniref:DUF6590 domain-containing protein n=1 Tax=Pseudocercospora musae TaxID=113226 RepID=A0A139IH97_9PEZI|nr:hypothetical protein AC579_9259 [Pseudocercospora musae]